MAVKRQIFYSFHYQRDVFRVQQIRNMRTLKGNKPLSANKWETIRKSGKASIKKWIDDNMKYRSCIVVLIGEETSKRYWVKYEIKKAWNEGKGILGIHINNLKDPKTGKSAKGSNPFDRIRFMDKNGNIRTILCKSPKANDAYSDIKNNITAWVEEAIKNNN